MTRGTKPVVAISEAKKFAGKMGYRWQENSENPDLCYDFMAFKPGYAFLVKVRQTRYTIDPEAMYEDLLPDIIREVRELPFPPWMPREIWLRTQHERTWRRLRVYDPGTGVWEIGWWGPDGYVNKYAP